MPPPNVGATLVSPGKPTQRRNWPETPRTPHRAMPRTGRAVPAPGVINGAPTSITARITVATPQDTAAKRRGDTCVARKTVATPQLAGNIAYNAANNAADGSCRAGTGRHKWRPYVHHRPPAVATAQDAAAKRRGDTCVARTTDATPQLAGITAHTAANNAADGSCRAGTGRHKWRPYVHHRPNNRRNAAIGRHHRAHRIAQCRGRVVPFRHRAS